MKIPVTAIIGGGFSGLMVAAHIVRDAQSPLALVLIAASPENSFGPAYSTPRMEHLLNVPACNMGAFADKADDFSHWLEQQGIQSVATDFMPRMVYGRYLADIWRETQSLAAQKNISLSRQTAQVTDVDETAEGYSVILTDGAQLAVQNIVLATGNALKTQEDNQTLIAGLIRQPWQFDFSSLTPSKKNPVQKNIAIIGSGLTAADTIISILDTGWAGHIDVYSRSGLLPRAHLAQEDKTNLIPYRLKDFKGLRLAGILHRLRHDMRQKNIDWHYIIDSLRPITPALWAQLAAQDKLRLRKKYFTLWNVHRHRYAPHIGGRIDAAIATGQITLVRARVSGTTAAQNGGVTLRFSHLPATQVDLAFECIGVEYQILEMPLYKNMDAKGLVTPLPPYGIAVGDDFATHHHPADKGAIYALGTPLFGQFFETTAVPELRKQAAAVAVSLLKKAPRHGDDGVCG